MNLFDAIKYGSSLAFCVGPTFFYLLGISIKQGLTKAINFALGVAISDVFILMLVLFGLGSFFQSESFKHWFNLVSAILMIFVGIYYIRASKHPEVEEIKDDVPIKKGSNFKFFMKGIVINGFNPFSGMLWVFIGAQVKLPQNVNFQEIAVFTLTLAGTIFFFDCTKAFLAKSIKRFLTPKNLQRIDLVLGVIFIGISGYFFLEFGKIYI